MNQRTAPIALFTFKRPEHTRRTLESLAQNPEFTSSSLFIFCDGARNDAESDEVDKTRKLVRDWPHPNKLIVERDRNWGLANSIIEGVTDLCDRFGRVIVVEDDLVVSPVFLNYLNTALDLYANEQKVMQVSAHMFPVNIQSQFDAVMLPVTTSWGWATWDRAWQYFDPSISGFNKLNTDKSLRRKFDFNGSYPCFKMLERLKEGKVDSWAIRWYLSVFLEGGLVLFPEKTLVINDGFDGSGSNCKRSQSRGETLRLETIDKFPEVRVDEQAYNFVTRYLRKEQFVLTKIIKQLGGVMSNKQSIAKRVKKYLTRHPRLCLLVTRLVALLQGLLALRPWLATWSRCYIDKTVKVTGWSHTRIGLNSVVAAGTWLNVNVRKGSEPTLIIGENCFLGRNNFITVGKRVVIGDYCLTATNCVFVCSSHNIENPNMPYISTGVDEDSEIRVGANCFFGYGTMVLGAVTIGYGSVIGAGAVVMKNVPPLSVVIGNPGRVVKRFSFSKNDWVSVKDYVEEDLLSEEEYLANMRRDVGYYPLPISAARSTLGDV